MKIICEASRYGGASLSDFDTGEDEMELKNEESGMLVVEASLYLPISIMLIAFLICYGIAKLQQCVLFFEAEKIANEIARCEVYPGYEEILGDDTDLSVDIVEFPDEAGIKNYYKAQALDLYNWGLDHRSQEDKFQKRLKKLVTSVYLLAPAGVQPTCDVEIKGVLVPKVTVSVTYKIDFPKMFEYLVDGADTFDQVYIGAQSKSVAVKPAEFVRNVDIAADIADFLMEKLGIKGTVTSFTGKMKEIKERFL